MFNSFPKKLLLIFLLCTLGFLYFAIEKGSKKNKEVYGEISQLEKQAASLETEKNSLNDLISFFETPSFQERESKEQLGLQNPGEKVIVITKDKEPNAEILEPAKEEKKNSNAEKWWKVIFGE